MGIKQLTDHRPQDTIVSVQCNEPLTDTSYFHIHKTLLFRNLADSYLSSAHKDIIELDVSSDGFRLFALWLYTGKCDDKHLYNNCWGDSITELLRAHKVGRELGCVDFQDTVVDALMKTLTDCEGSPICDTLGEYLEEFPFQSFGRQLLVEVIAYGPAEKGVSDEEDMRFDYNALKSIDDPQFICALAREIMAATGCQMPLDTMSEELRTMLVCGFLEMKAQGDTTERSAEEMPWLINPCRYHRHTELGLPCYNSKQ